MSSVRFTCSESLAIPPQEIASQILDLSRWPEFEGYGPLPGIRSAEFECRTDDVVGTRILVHNNDGSHHVEEITKWNPSTAVELTFGSFSPPLSRLARSFIETWTFSVGDGITHVERSFELHPRSVVFFPVMWVISLPLRRAIARHLDQMKTSAVQESSGSD